MAVTALPTDVMRDTNQRKNEKAPLVGGAFCFFGMARRQFTRVQVWPPQNMPPNAQPCTRSVSGPFSAIVES